MKYGTKLSLLALTSLLLMLALAGCSDDETYTATTPDATEDVATVDKDAAEAVAADVSADSGGLTDQIADMAYVIGSVGVAKEDEGEPGVNRPVGSIDRVYDDATGTWTITISRERGLPDGVPYASIDRVYTMRFLNEAGEPMMFRVVDGDTASSAEFAIVSGTGIHRNRVLEQELKALTGSFVITNLDQELVTINGSYHREAGQHLETPSFSRTLDSVMDLELVDVVAPHRWRLDFATAVSGTVNGTFVADVVIERGDDYIEDHIEREFTIVFGDGEGDMVMNGNLYRLNLGDGELCGD